jgi:gamma-glutamyltranspeptidase/glutathione hydrolase
MKSKLLRLLKWLFAIILMAIVVLVIAYWIVPKGPADLMPFDDPWGQEREMVTAAQYGVIAGTPWASQAAMDVLESGGNVYDAAIAGLFMLYVTHGEASGFPGIAPMMIYNGAEDSIKGYIGVGKAPKLASIARFKERGFEVVPSMDIYAQLIPGGPDAVIAILKAYGTMTLSQLIQPAIARAKEGFPIHHVMHYNMDLSLQERLGYRYLLPYNAKVYLGSTPWKPLHLGDRFRRPDLADTFISLSKVELTALREGQSRSEALDAVRAHFYNGPIAEAITEMHTEQDGLIQREDLASYQGAWETAYHGSFGEYEVYVNGPWSQGMTLVMALDLLSHVDLKSMGQNSGKYIHTVTQAIELVMSDREAYFGDPDYVDVPSDQLLDQTYGVARSKTLTDAAFTSFPLPIAIDGYTPYISPHSNSDLPTPPRVGDDTSQIIVADSSGNVIAITPSDFPMTPMVPDWDLTMGNRMNQFRLDPNHPASLVPGKRPRVTPQAVMLRKNGEFYMAINTPGGDNQIQAMLQVLLNHIVYEDNIQIAIERPRFRTLGFPGSFSPHDISSATIEVEENMNNTAVEGLKQLRYKVKLKERWGIAAGVGAAIKTSNGYMLGADPRAETVALGY